MDEINLEDRLESDLGLDDLHLMDLHTTICKSFKTDHGQICPFETWGDMIFLFSKEHKVPYFDFSVAELIDMIVRSGIIKKPLTKKVKEFLSQYDFSGFKRAKTEGDKFKIRVLTTPQEPGSFFITDPFVVSREQHDTVDAIMKLFYYEELRKSD